MQSDSKRKNISSYHNLTKIRLLSRFTNDTSIVYIYIDIAVTVFSLFDRSELLYETGITTTITILNISVMPFSTSL